MKIEYLHASKFGNGLAVAAEFQKQMAGNGVVVDVHHVRQVKPTELSPADLYVFGSPGRIGKPIRSMRRFLKKVDLPRGTRYAILTTEVAPKPDKKTGAVPTEVEFAKKTGHMPTEAALDKYRRVRPIMNELLQNKGLVKVAEDTIYVTGLKGPLEDGWEKKVQAFAAEVLGGVGERPEAGTGAPAERQAPDEA